MASLLAGVTLLKFQPYWTFVFFFFYSDDILTKIGCIKKWWKGCKNMAFGRTQTLCNTHFGNLRMTLRIYFWRIDFYIIWILTSSPSPKYSISLRCLKPMAQKEEAGIWWKVFSPKAILIRAPRDAPAHRLWKQPRLTLFFTTETKRKDQGLVRKAWRWICFVGGRQTILSYVDSE